jgi:hypothetical protein
MSWAGDRWHTVPLGFEGIVSIVSMPEDYG